MDRGRWSSRTPVPRPSRRAEPTVPRRSPTVAPRRGGEPLPGPKGDPSSAVGAVRSGGLLLLISALLVGTACDPHGADEAPAEVGDVVPDGSRTGAEVVLVDHQGREVRLAAPPRRILSLVPSATEVVRELGGEDRLVGRTDYDTASALANLPSVGGGLEPGMERVVALEPDLVIRFHADSDPATPLRLDEAGLPHLAIRPDGIAEIEEIVAMVGVVLGREEAAAKVRDGIREGLAEVADAVPDGERPTVAYLVGGDPPWVAGPGTFLDELLEVAGGRNVFADLERLYAPVSSEELVARRPDVVLLGESERAPRLPGNLPVRRVPDWIERPGTRVAEAARELAQALRAETDP